MYLLLPFTGNIYIGNFLRSALLAVSSETGSSCVVRETGWTWELAADLGCPNPHAQVTLV